MKVKLMMHLMPWELDHTLLTFVKLKKSFEYLPKDTEILFECVLNLSSAVINWDETAIPKEYFIKKFKTLKSLIECFNVVRYDVIETDELYGHFNLQRESIDETVDGYIYLCTDQNFDETTLAYMCKTAKSIKDKYFILTTEIYKGWDITWDAISNEKYKNVPYEECGQQCAYKIEYDNFYNDVYVKKINQIKFAGWFDYYSKDFINEFAKFPDSWVGYGPWDLYTIILSEQYNRMNLDEKINQYVLSGKLIYPIESAPYPTGFSGYYKDMIKKTDLDQRHVIEKQINSAIVDRLSQINSGNL
jgi:hypothetical protein